MKKFSVMGSLRNNKYKDPVLLGYILAENGNDARRRARKKYPKFIITDVLRKV